MRLFAIRVFLVPSFAACRRDRGACARASGAAGGGCVAEKICGVKFVVGSDDVFQSSGSQNLVGLHGWTGDAGKMLGCVEGLKKKSGTGFGTSCFCIEGLLWSSPENCFSVMMM